MLFSLLLYFSTGVLKSTLKTMSFFCFSNHVYLKNLLCVKFVDVVCILTLFLSVIKKINSELFCLL